MRASSCTTKTHQGNAVKGAQEAWVIASDGQLASLVASRLSLEQKAHIRMICEQKLQAFVQKSGNPTEQCDEVLDANGFPSRWPEDKPNPSAKTL
jgi:hypothetical protein